MNARRTFQIASGMLALIYSIAMLAAAVMVIIPIFDSKMFEPFNGWAHTLRDTVVPKLSFLPQEGPWGGVIVAAVMFGLPGLLLFFAMLALFRKSKNGKQGLHTFGSLLGLLGILIFGASVGMCAIMKDINLFGEDKLTYLIIVGAACVFMLLLLILSMAKFGKNKNADQAEQPADVAPNPQMTETVANTTANTETNQTGWNPYGTPQQNYAQEPAQTPITEYDYSIYDSKTVRDIVDRTYGASSENVGSNNMKKIQTLRSLLDAGAITKDEYIALVNAYLGK